MSTAPETTPRRRVAIRGCVCPSCAASIDASATRCPSCGFTGGDTIDLFSDEAPPLLPVLDAVGLWSKADVERIETAREKVRRRFPQIHWRVCLVDLPPDTRLPVFGFWLMNVSEKYVNESDDERAWTVLLLIDASSGRAAVVPGYAAEGCMDDADWRKILIAIKPLWRAGRSAEAVVRFFETASGFLEHSWRAISNRRRK